MPDGKPSATFHFAAGALSGVSTAVLLQPADLLKTRLQQSHSTTLRDTLRSISAGPSPLKQLWRGTLPSAIRTGVGSALYFSLLASVREAIRPVAEVGILPNSGPGDKDYGGKNKGNGGMKKSSSALPALPAHLNLLAGATSRAAAGFVLMPVTVLKVRYESSLYAYTSLLGAGRDVLRTEGLRGFFAGSGATAVRDAPYAGLYVLFYEAGKAELGKLVGLRDARKRNATGIDTDASDGRSGTTMAPAINFTSGILAAGFATALTNPFDAVKTRLQLMPKRYSNMVQAAKLMLRQEGVRSLFDGLGLRIARKGMSSALAWTVYEELVRRAEVKIFQASQESRL